MCVLHQLKNGEYSPVLEALFVMVARDPENKRYVGLERPEELLDVVIQLNLEGP